VKPLPGPDSARPAAAPRDAARLPARTVAVLLSLAAAVCVILAAIQTLTNALVQFALPGDDAPGFFALLFGFALPATMIWLLLLFVLLRITPPSLARIDRIDPRWVGYWLAVTIAIALVHAAALSAFVLAFAADPPAQRAVFERLGVESQWAAFLFEYGRNLRQSAWMSLLSAGIVLIRAHRFEAERQRIRNAELSMHLARARLEALSARLNPHFLFNALHTLSALVHADPDRAIGGIARLGEVLRASLDRSERQFVSLGEEVDFSRDYLGIEFLRYDRRIDCRWRIDPGALDLPVPPFVLQPLIENAVKYGVDRSSGRTAIDISAHVQQAHLLIEVVHRSESGGDLDVVRRGLSSGISNLRARMDALYGEGVWLIEQRYDDRGSETVLLLPLASTDVANDDVQIDATART
jgi:hypothetical protein